MIRPTLEQDRARWIALEEQRATIVEEQAAIKARVAEQLKVGQSRELVDGGKVAVSPNHKFHPDLAQQVLGREVAAGRLDPTQVAACWTTPEPSLVSAKVKQILAPTLYEACMKDAGAPRVTIQ